MQGLAGEGEVGLAEGLVLGGVGVHQGGDVLGVGLPAVDQLGLADQLADAVADEVDADDGAVGAADQLDEALGLEDLALAVAAEVVGEGLDARRRRSARRPAASLRPTEATSGWE